MCGKIIYRKSGSIYKCICPTDEGEELLLGEGTREEILSWLVTHGLGYVSKDVLEQDIYLLSIEG